MASRETGKASVTFAQLWDLAFTSFEVFVGVGLIWLGLIEQLFPSRELSVQLMVVAAVAAAAGSFYYGWRRVRQRSLAAQARMEAADAEYGDEIG